MTYRMSNRATGDPLCSFDAFIERYELADRALTTLPAIVRGAATDDRGLTPSHAARDRIVANVERLVRELTDGHRDRVGL